MPRWSWTLLPLFVFSCAEAPARPTRPAVPIKSACTAGSRPASSAGIDVRQGRRHSEARTIFVKNVGDRPRALSVQQIARVEGPCGGDWARQTPLDFADRATGAPPRPRVMQPNEEVQIQIGPQRVQGTWSCAKIGLSLQMKVDDEVVCADAGAWIAEREADD